MAKVLLIVGAVLLGVIAFLLFGQNDGGDRASDAYDPTLDDETLEDGPDGPMLEAAPAPIRRPNKGAERDSTGPTRPTFVDWISGTVVDSKSGRPIAGASLRTEPVAEPCPRLPSYGRPRENVEVDPTSSKIPMRQLVHGSTNEKGEFTLQKQAGAPLETVDLFVFAKGYMTGCVCRIGPTDDLVVRLDVGKKILGRVTNTAGHAIPNAQVATMLPGGKNNTIGTVSEATTDEEGKFVLEHLGDTPVVVMIDHPHYMSFFSDPIQPNAGTDADEKEFQLLPAWRLTFRVRSDDGRAIENPTIQWKTNGEPPQFDLDLLAASPVGPPASPSSELESAVVKIPCYHRTADIQIKADGYLPWKTTDEPLPPDGGEQLFQVLLERDMSVGALRLHLVNTKSEPIHYAESNVIVRPIWLGSRDTLPGAYVLEPSEILTVPALKAGKYRFRIAAPDYAPIETDITIEPGRLNDVTVEMGPPAKIRLKFVASEPLDVVFRITKDGRPVMVFPEGQTVDQPTGADPDPIRVPGGSGEGAVISGLSGGAHTIEVTSEDLVPVSRTVELEPDQTTDVEIEVQRR